MKKQSVFICVHLWFQSFRRSHAACLASTQVLDSHPLVSVSRNDRLGHAPVLFSNSKSESITLGGVPMRRATAFVLTLFLISASLIALNVGAQEQPDPRTLLSPQVLNAIANEVSGAQAYNHVIDMCGYE